MCVHTQANINISKLFQIRLIFYHLAHSNSHWKLQFTGEKVQKNKKESFAHLTAFFHSNLSHLDNSSLDKLLNLAHHHWVLRVFLSRLGILLEVNQHLKIVTKCIITTTHSCNHLRFCICFADLEKRVTRQFKSLPVS